MTEVYIGVGSNINPEEHILKSFLLLKEKATITATSTFYYTKPLNQRKQPEYCNGVWKINTSLKPYPLKYDLLRGIEAGLGRKRSDDSYASRTIDLDILLYGKEVIKTDTLDIPDPDIYTRVFVCIPLFEITPDLTLPDSGKSIREIALKMNTGQMKPAHYITDHIKKGIKYE